MGGRVFKQDYCSCCRHPLQADRKTSAGCYSHPWGTKSRSVGSCWAGEAEGDGGLSACADGNVATKQAAASSFGCSSPTIIAPLTFPMLPKSAQSSARQRRNEALARGRWRCLLPLLLLDGSHLCNGMRWTASCVSLQRCKPASAAATTCGGCSVCARCRASAVSARRLPHPCPSSRFRRCCRCIRLPIGLPVLFRGR